MYGDLETCAWLGIYINPELFLFLFFEYSVQKKLLWEKVEEGGGGGYGAIAPLAPRCRRASISLFD